MSRFIILGISLLLGVSLISHNTLLSQSPSKMEGDSQEKQLQSVIENEKNIVKNDLEAIKNKTNTVKNEPNIVRNKPKVVINKTNTVVNKPNVIENKRNFVGNKTEVVEKETNEKTGPTKQVQARTHGPVLANNANQEQQPKEQSQPVGVDETKIIGNIVYRNTQYGFDFSLPQAWKGYTIVSDEWEGVPIGGSQTIETGPEILIRHPLWTNENPRQDIPIIIFTLEQWNALQQEKFHIGAAPIGPIELGRNNSYVFALPARYNYAFPTGYEEVEEILKGKPLQAFEIDNSISSLPVSNPDTPSTNQ